MQKNWRRPPGDDDKSLCGSVLEVKNVLIIIPAVFGLHRRLLSPNSVAVLPEYTGINDYPIKRTFQVTHWHSDIVHPQKRPEPSIVRLRSQ